MKSELPREEFSGLKGEKRYRLIAERKKRKLTQKQLGEKLGYGCTYISHLENGRNKPGLEISLKLQEFFKVSYEKLFPDL